MVAQPGPVTLPDESVRIYLAERDTPCPGCGYNLRGIQESTCPECGRAIELTLSRPGRSRGYLLFVLLAFGWVLTAGTMNGVREWSRIKVQATPRAAMTTFRFMTATSSGSTQTITTNSGVITLNASGGVTVRQTPRAAGPKVGMAWGNVSRDSWINLGWWSSLGLLALTGLVLALVLRRRFNRDAPPWKLVALSAAAFALYAGHHAVIFSRDFIF